MLIQFFRSTLLHLLLLEVLLAELLPLAVSLNEHALLALHLEALFVLLNLECLSNVELKHGDDSCVCELLWTFKVLAFVQLHLR